MRNDPQWKASNRPTSFWEKAEAVVLGVPLYGGLIWLVVAALWG
jgi:hypothetical protein